jgi:hypothetical protein
MYFCRHLEWDSCGWMDPNPTTCVYKSTQQLCRNIFSKENYQNKKQHGNIFPNIYIYIYRAKLEWNIKMRLQQKETSKCTWKIQDNDTSNACKMMHTSYWSVRTCMFLPRLCLYVPDPVRWSFGLLFGRL